MINLLSLLSLFRGGDSGAESCLNHCDPARLQCPWDFPDKHTGVGFHFLLQFLRIWLFSLTHFKAFLSSASCGAIWLTCLEVFLEYFELLSV